jgi:hypothetical protein
MNRVARGETTNLQQDPEKREADRGDERLRRLDL